MDMEGPESGFLKPKIMARKPLKVSKTTMIENRYYSIWFASRLDTEELLDKEIIQDILPQDDDPAGAMLESFKGNTIGYGLTEHVSIMAVAVETPDNALKVKTVKHAMVHARLTGTSARNLKDPHGGSKPNVTLFDYCFPAVKQQLRMHLMNVHQGQETVRDFTRKVQSLAKRVPDINERHLAHLLGRRGKIYMC
jgi:hypothetical protein